MKHNTPKHSLQITAFVRAERAARCSLCIKDTKPKRRQPTLLPNQSSSSQHVIRGMNGPCCLPLTFTDVLGGRRRVEHAGERVRQSLANGHLPYRYGVMDLFQIGLFMMGHCTSTAFTFPLILSRLSGVVPLYFLLLPSLNTPEDQKT